MARMILNETSYFGAGCRREVVGEMNRRNMKRRSSSPTKTSSASESQKR